MQIVWWKVRVVRGVQRYPDERSGADRGWDTNTSTMVPGGNLVRVEMGICGCSLTMPKGVHFRRFMAEVGLGGCACLSLKEERVLLAPLRRMFA